MPKLFRNNVAYAVGGVANSLALFLLIPFLVTSLSTTEYGLWSLFEVVILLLAMVSLAGLDVGLMRQYWSLPEGEARRTLVGTTVLGMVGWGIVLLGLTFLFTLLLGMYPAIATSLNLNFSMQAIWLVAGIGITESWFNLLVTVLRIREQALLFVVLSVGRMALFVALAVAGVVLGYGVEGALLGRLAASVVGIAVAAITVRGFITISWNAEMWQRIMGYGLPLLPTALATYVLLSSDRYFLNIFASTATVAVYSFMYKLATVLDIIIIRPFALDWAPRRFKIATYAHPEESYSKVLLFFLWVICGFALLVWSGTGLVYAWLAKPAYNDGEMWVPVILLSMILYGLSYPLNVGILLKDKTKILPVLSWSAAGLCLLLNVWWIPLWGMGGAAWATVVAYAVFTGLLTIASQRLYPIRYPLRKIVHIVGLTVLGGIGIYGVNTLFAGSSVVLTTAIKVVWVVVAMLAAGVLVFGEEFALLRAKVIGSEAKS